MSARRSRHHGPRPNPEPQRPDTRNVFRVSVGREKCRFAGTSHAGGGTRTPDTRIMIPLLLALQRRLRGLGDRKGDMTALAPAVRATATVGGARCVQFGEGGVSVANGVNGRVDVAGDVRVARPAEMTLDRARENGKRASASGRRTGRLPAVLPRAVVRTPQQRPCDEFPLRRPGRGGHGAVRDAIRTVAIVKVMAELVLEQFQVK